MDTERYLKTEITDRGLLKACISTCVGTFTLLSENGNHIHYIFRRVTGNNTWTGTDRVFAYSPTTHGCVYLGEFTDFNFRLTKKSEVTKYSAEFRGLKYLEKLIRGEINKPKLKVYLDINTPTEVDDVYADNVFNHRGINNNDKTN